MLLICHLSSHKTILQLMKLRLLTLPKVTKLEVAWYCLAPKTKHTERLFLIVEAPVKTWTGASVVWVLRM